MVLERLFPAAWVERRTFFAFILGFSYSVIGIGLAMLMFPKDPALVAVAITSILLLPEINEFFKIERKELEHLKKVSFADSWKATRRFARTYIILILGVFLVYSIAGIVLDNMTVSVLFREQLSLRGAAAGTATGSAFLYVPALGAILLNNLIVLGACFSLAFLTGDGAIFLLVWNASVWGTVFGVTAASAAQLTAKNPFVYLLLILITVLPHALIEMLAYVFAGISGGALSNVIIRKPHTHKVLKTIVQAGLMVLVFALVALILGALIESFVLQQSEVYSLIIHQGLM